MARENITEYQNAVEYYAANKINTVFYNKGDLYATVVFDTIFRYAKKKILIAAGNLNNDVTNSEKYLESMRKFLNQDNVELFIFVSEIKKEGNKLFELLRDYKDKVNLKCSDGRMFTNNNHDIIHFCVADEYMYRIENDTKERRASCNLNDIAMCKKLSDSFMLAYNQCTNTFSIE